MGRKLGVASDGPPDVAPPLCVAPICVACGVWHCWGCGANMESFYLDRGTCHVVVPKLYM